jgi:hypothetical protein
MTPNAAVRPIRPAPGEIPESSRFGLHRRARLQERPRRVPLAEQARIAREGQAFFARFG